MLSNLVADIRYTIRTLRRHPGFTGAAIVPIALGVGINTGIFSILEAIAWRRVSSPHPTVLVGVYGVVSYGVSRRLREIVIRMVLGASLRDAQALVLAQTLRPVVIGVLVGVGGAPRRRGCSTACCSASARSIRSRSSVRRSAC